MKSSLLYPVQLFWRLFERSLGNNAQTLIAACDPDSFRGVEFTGKVLSDHSTDFYDKQFTSKGRRVILTFNEFYITRED